MKVIAGLTVMLVLGPGTASGLELCALFSNNAVLQRDQPVTVWGWDEPGAKVTVEFAGQKVASVADESGRWEATLQPLKPNKEPQELVASARDGNIIRKNILVGDVWLCSGQSNMLMTFTTGRLLCDMPDFVKPGEYPIIRHLKVGPGQDGSEPQRRLLGSQVRGGWTVCDAESYKGFSAAAFFFAYTLAKEVDVPIGLVNCTQGNTRIDSWMSPSSADSIKDQVPRETLRAVYSKTPFTLYNTTIAPVAGFAIKGAIWYQGEANGKEGDSYYWKLKALIEGWREDWGQGAFPFYYVQLPSFNGRGSWAPIREAQRKALTIPNTGMVVLTDAGDTAAQFPINLHPRNKYVVGKRLALWALAKDYGRRDLVFSGPLLKSAEFGGGVAVVSFDHVGGGLMAAKKPSSRSVDPPQPMDEVLGFEIAAADKQWRPAKARIDGGKVILSADAVKEPVAVRYLYTMNTDHGTLYNKEGLPASPFRTDDW